MQQVARRFLREARAQLDRGHFAHLVTDLDDLDGKIPGSRWRERYALEALLLEDLKPEDVRHYAGSTDAPVWPRLVWRRN